jgi:hypothetical protein
MMMVVVVVVVVVVLCVVIGICHKTNLLLGTNVTQLYSNYQNNIPLPYVTACDFLFY